MLIEHMKQGGSFESFAALAECCYDTLYEWEKKHPEFSESKKQGVALSRRFWEDMGKAMAMGRLTRLVKEEPMIDSNGNVVIDPRTGQVLTRKEYGPAATTPTVWIFAMKNMHGWRDKKDINVGGQLGNPANVSVMHQVQLLNDHELQKRYDELMDKAKQETTLVLLPGDE